ncbi:IcmF-related protein [Pseudomonas sp. FEN]|nr:IcmF-related protein [Pseudomonas sp. FEN]
MAEPRQRRRGSPVDLAAVGQRALRDHPGRALGLVRLLEQSDLVAGNSPDRFNLRLRVDGASISYELRASSAFNPFKSRVLSGFSLPERL